MPCAITSSTARAPTRHHQTTDEIQQQSSASRVREENLPELLATEAAPL